MVKISDFEKIYNDRHSLAWQWKKEGKKIFGYIYSLMPEEILYAGGIIPVQLTESEDTEDLRMGKVYTPETFCDYSLSLAGQGIAGVYEYLDGVIFNDACSQTKTACEVWAEKCKPLPPFFDFMMHPDQQDEGSIKFYIASIDDLRKRVGKFIGKDITDDDIRNAVEVYNENRRLVKNLYEMRLVDNPPILGSQVFSVMKAGLVMPKDLHNKMLAELLEEIPKWDPPQKEKRPRIMAWSHIFEECAGKTFPNFIQMIEEMGADVVHDELCQGARYYDGEVVVKPNILEALAERYLGNVPHSTKYTTKERIQNIDEINTKYRLDGIIFFLTKYCQPDWFQQFLIEKAMKEKDIPFMTVETVAGMPKASVRTRLEAFIEMIK
ncbi:MAG: 2-hydroxyacyl-CoA dehydratase [Deltaproteobacteria bacterium]|nr:2-hydroxyacyl-CoA dehydratase [Deltaproteobacteria bacterium]